MSGDASALTVARLGSGGDGIVETAEGRIYVPGALPGDVVRVSATSPIAGGRRALAHETIRAVPRAPPRCSHVATCGGCGLQHLPADLYAAFKPERIRAALARVGLVDVPIGATRTSPPGSRRRARLAFRAQGRRVELGFRAARGQRIVDLQDCAVLQPSLVALLPGLRTLLGALGLDHGEVLLTAAEPGPDVVLRADRRPGLAALEAVAAAARTLGLARLSWDAGAGAEPIVAPALPRVRLGGADVAIPPSAFLQATAEGEAALVGLVTTWLHGRAPFLDLFAGCGTLALPLAAEGPVRAVELDGDALAAAVAASRGRVIGERRDLDRRPLAGAELAAYRGVVLDPPRRGAAAQVAALTRAPAVRLAYVSCYPESFSRDAAVLVGGGWRLVEVVPVDQFLWSAEVELVGLFAREAAA